MPIVGAIIAAIGARSEGWVRYGATDRQESRLTIYFNEGGSAWEAVGTVLRRRGHVIATRGDPLQTVLPPIPGEVRQSYLETHGSDQFQRAFGDNTFAKHVALYGHGSARKMFRHLMASPSRAASKKDLVAIAGRRTEDYLEFYGAIQVITEDGETIRLNVSHDNLGPSLEQYVAMLCMAELKGHAEWSVALEGIENGDFDVIAWLPPRIVYIECKTGAPGNVGASAFQQMSLRIRDLSPDLAILLVDSEDDLAPLCYNAYRSSAKWRLHAQPGFKGIYYGVFQHWPIYVINADPSILTQIRLCLRHFYSQGQWKEGLWGSIWAENDESFGVVPSLDQER